METFVHAPLNQLDSSLSALVSTLTTSPSFANAPATASALVAADDVLTSALVALKQHQTNYLKILRLRDEATRLQTHIKDTVRTCGDLRNEIAAVCGPRILEESESDDEDEDADDKVDKVDYHTLLSFARRLGKHNALAAREAEEEALKRKLEAREREAKAVTSVTNGLISNADGADQNKEPNVQNVITEGEQGWLNEMAMHSRFIGAMAFPAADKLALGELGQLQRLFDEGKDAEMILEEQIAKSEGWELSQRDDNIRETVVDMPDDKRTSIAQTSSKGPLSSARPVALEKKKSVAPLNLDLWDEDEDDED